MPTRSIPKPLYPPLRHPSQLLRSLQCPLCLPPRLLRSLWSPLSPSHTTASFVNSGSIGSSGNSVGASAPESTRSKLSLMRCRHMSVLIRFQTGRSSSPVNPRICLPKNSTSRVDKRAVSQEYYEGHPPSESMRSCAPLSFYGHGYFGSNV
jgi:hypothetical protein